MMRFSALLLASGWVADSGSPCPRLHACAAGEDRHIWVAVHVAASVYGADGTILLRCPSTTAPVLTRHRSALGLV